MSRAIRIGYYVELFIKGFFMGVANIIPGISGGTMAFIMGIYEEFLIAIKSFNLNFFNLLLHLNIKKAFQSTSWRFLLTVVGGIFTATLTLAKGLNWLLIHQQTYIYAFFWGLILASGVIIWQRIENKSVVTFALVVVSAIVSFYLVGMVPVSTPKTPVFIFLGGVVSICAMILPGISGAFILLVLGQYQYLLEAINTADIFTLSVFLFGTIVGIMSFARVVSWLFKRFRHATMAILIGLMLGSLRRIWPWKVTVLTIVKHGHVVPLVERNVFPLRFNAEMLLAVVFMGVGLFSALIIEWWANHKSQ